MLCNLKSLDANPGRGTLAFRRVNGKTEIVRSRCNSPLTLLSPKSHGDCAWIICGTHGGGLVEGDAIHLDVTLEKNTAAIVGTQASTKAYRCAEGRASRQALIANLEDNAMLLLVPDPVTCFGGAIYQQRQRFELAASSSLLMLDWFTSGRHSRGERWDFLSYRSRTDVFVQGRQIFRDALRLDAADGSLISGSRMGRFNCFATVLLIGDRLAAGVSEILKFVAAQALTAGADLIFAAAPLANGAWLRVAGESVEAVSQFVRERLFFVTQLIGQNPWAGKA